MSNPPVVAKRLGDVSAIGTLLDVSPKTIRRMADAGRIPGVTRLGRLLRFDLEAIDLWIDQGCPPIHKFNRNSSKM